MTEEGPLEEWPTYDDKSLKGDLGVAMVKLAVARDLSWVFRDKPQIDLGLDGEIEVREPDGTTRGRVLSVQIKCGSSFFRSESDADQGQGPHHHPGRCASGRVSKEADLAAAAPSGSTCPPAITAAQHKKCPGHAAYLIVRDWAGTVETVYVCTDWETHSHRELQSPPYLTLLDRIAVSE